MRAVRMISLLTLLLAIGTACAPAPATPTIPPEIRITRPATGTAFAEGANILILVEAADSGPGITRILLALDGQAVNERQFSAAADISTSFDWLALGTGSHSLSVTAYRADGTSSPAAQVQITVAAPTATPTVTPTQTPIPPPPTPKPPTATPVPAPSESSPAGDAAAMTIEGTNVRTGPGLSYAVAFVLAEDTPVNVIGRNADESWLQVAHYPDPKNTAWVREGWIYAPNLNVSGETADLEIVYVAPPGGANAAAAGAGAAPAPAGSSTDALVALNQPITSGTGQQICRNPNLIGSQIHYYNWLNGVSDWWLEEYVGIPLEGGATEGVRSQTRAPGNVIGLGQYLLPRYESTAVEMGGTWRTFSWAMGQDNVPVKAGHRYTLQAIFHPFVQVLEPGTNAEIWANADNTSDWERLMNWRWVVVGSDGTKVSDWWHNASGFGITTWNLPPQNEHFYSFSFQANQDDTVSVFIQFQNVWPIAVSKIWMHAARCYEFPPA